MTYAPVQLICFDLGRVLMQLRHGWSAACAAANVPYTIESDSSHHQAMLEVVCRNERGEIDDEQFDCEFAAILGLDAAQVTAAATAWLAGPYPGVGELLDQLAALPVQTACLSNTNARHWQIMCSTGHECSLPMHRLDHHFASHLVGCRKPETGIYEHVERTTGLAPYSILFFDDLPENIAAARQRGWQGMVVDDLHDPVRQIRDHLTALGVLNNVR